MADKVTGRGGQGGISARGDLLIAQTQGVGGNLGVDIARGAGHVARAYRLAAGGFHCLVEIAGHVPRRGIARMQARVVKLVAQRKRVGGAARQQNLFARHPAADLRQAHRIARDPGGIDRIADRKIGVVGHHLGGLRQRLLERIGGIVGGFVHRLGSRSFRLILSVAKRVRMSTCTSSGSMTR